MHPMQDYNQAPYNPVPPLSTWTNDQIVLMMRESRFDEATCQAFQQQRIDGVRLMQLSMLDLRPPLFFGDAYAANCLLSMAHPSTNPSYLPIPHNTTPMYTPSYPANSHTYAHPPQNPYLPQGEAGTQASPLIHHPPAPQGIQTVHEMTFEGIFQIDQARGSFIPNRTNRRTMGFILGWIFFLVAIIVPLAYTRLEIYSIIITIIFALLLMASFWRFYKYVTEPSYEFSPTGARMIPFRGEVRDVPKVDLKDVYITAHHTTDEGTTTTSYTVGLTLRPGVMISGSNKLQMRIRFDNLGSARNVVTALSRLMGLPLQENL